MLVNVMACDCATLPFQIFPDQQEERLLNATADELRDRRLLIESEVRAVKAVPCR